jgi:hypothetical protein
MCCLGTRRFLESAVVCDRKQHGDVEEGGAKCAGAGLLLLGQRRDDRWTCVEGCDYLRTGMNSTLD